MKITTSHSMIKSILKVTSSFYVLLYPGACTNNYFEYGTFYKSFILGFLVIVYTNGE